MTVTDPAPALDGIGSPPDPVELAHSLLAGEPGYVPPDTDLLLSAILVELRGTNDRLDMLAEAFGGLGDMLSGGGPLALVGKLLGR